MRCPLVPATTRGTGPDDIYYGGAKAIDGYQELSANSYGSVMGELFSQLPKRLGKKVAVYGRGYDFRQSNVDSATFLAPKLNTIYRDHKQPMIIIAHSMGGLVARYYAHQLGGAKKIRAMFLVGSPTLGAPKIYMMLRKALPLIDFARPAVGFANRFFQSMAHLMPSVYEMLPHPRLMQRGTGREWLEFDSSKTGCQSARTTMHPFPVPENQFDSVDAPQLYQDPHTGLGDPQMVSRSLLARNFRKRMAEGGTLAGRVNVHPQTYILYNASKETIVGCVAKERGYGGQDIDTLSVKKRDGDESVPVASAKPHGRHHVFRTPIAGRKSFYKGRAVQGVHAGLPSTPSSINVLVNEIAKLYA